MQENTVIGELIIKYVKMKLFFCLSLPLLASVQTQQNNDLYVNMPDPKSQIQQRDQFTLLVHKMRLSIIQFKKDALLYTQKEDFDAIKMAEMVRAYLIQMDKMLINFDLSSNSNVILSNLSDWDFHPLINFPYIEASCWKSFFQVKHSAFLKEDLITRKERIDAMIINLSNRVNRMEAIYRERITRPVSTQEAERIHEVRENLRQGLRPFRK